MKMMMTRRRHVDASIARMISTGGARRAASVTGHRQKLTSAEVAVAQVVALWARSVGGGAAERDRSPECRHYPRWRCAGSARSKSGRQRRRFHYDMISTEPSGSRWHNDDKSASIATTYRSRGEAPRKIYRTFLYRFEGRLVRLLDWPERAPDRCQLHLWRQQQCRRAEHGRARLARRRQQARAVASAIYRKLVSTARQSKSCYSSASTN